ncbi:hypothetical protein S245_065783 [Arachis hypogaea]
MKREWGLWAKLKGKETGIGWDSIKKTIQASDDWWDAEQENPDVAKFREKGPKHLDEIDAMRQKRRKVEKGFGASQLSTQLECTINVFEEEKANEIAHRNNVPSISTCLAALKQLPGLEVGSDIFLIATRLMAKRSNSEIFMGLEDSALQLGWLKTHSLADVSGF